MTAPLHTTIAGWLAQAQQELERVGIDSGRLDALLLLEHVLKRERSSLLAHDDEVLSAKQLGELNQLLTKRASRIPLAYLTKQREFYGLTFYVDERVLVPRPETEDMVTHILEHATPDATVLELGTGSGAIAIALASRRPDLKITATDVSPAALTVAKQNTAANGVHITYAISDLFTQLKPTPYDIIAANLPYVPLPARRQPEIESEPAIALFSGQDGLDAYRAFFAGLEPFTHQQTLVVLEFSPTQHSAVAELAKQAGWDMQALSPYIYTFTHCQ